VQCNPSCMVSNTCSPVPRVTFFLWHGLTTSTHATYRTGQKSFADFIMLYPQFRNTDSLIFPASQATLLKWVCMAWGSQRLQPKTIKSYITHLQFAHVDAGLSFSACELPMLHHVIRGIKRYMESMSALLSCPSHVMCSQEYWHQQPIQTCGAGSISRLQSPQHFSGFPQMWQVHGYRMARLSNPSMHILRSSVQFMPSITVPLHVIITIPSLKTDPFKKGLAITIASAPWGAHMHHCCPQRLIVVEYVASHLSHALFVQDDSAATITGVLHSSWVRAGLHMPAGFEASKSLATVSATAMASSAAAIGFNDYKIQLLVRCAATLTNCIDNSQACCFHLFLLALGCSTQSALRAAMVHVCTPGALAIVIANPFLKGQSSRMGW